MKLFNTILFNIFLLSACIPLLFTGCSDSESNDDNKKNIVDTSSNKKDTAKASIPDVDYAVPTPNRLFEVISRSDAQLQQDLISDRTKVSEFVTEKSKALNFGVYTADLAYLSSFGSSAKALDYFESIQKLGDELGISSAFDKTLVDRVEKNKANSDSIFLISNQTYYDTYAFLEENNKGPVLAMIIVGGWVESMHIVTNMVGEYDPNHPLIMDIVDQRIVLDQIIGFIEPYSDNEDVSNISSELLKILAAYDKMARQNSETKVKEKDGVVQMSGGTSFKMTPEAFKSIKKSISELRESITQ